MSNISSKAKIGKNVNCGYCVNIADNVVIEDNVTIGDYCLLAWAFTGSIYAFIWKWVLWIGWYSSRF